MSRAWPGRYAPNAGTIIALMEIPRGKPNCHAQAADLAAWLRRQPRITERGARVRKERRGGAIRIIGFIPAPPPRDLSSARAPAAESRATHFVLVRPWGVYVKTAEFFRRQLGHVKRWGREWRPVEAASVEAARALAGRAVPLMLVGLALSGCSTLPASGIYLEGAVGVMDEKVHPQWASTEGARVGHIYDRNVFDNPYASLAVGYELRPTPKLALSAELRHESAPFANDKGEDALWVKGRWYPLGGRP